MFYSEPCRSKKHVQEDKRNKCSTELDWGRWWVMGGRDSASHGYLHTAQPVQNHNSHQLTDGLYKFVLAILARSVIIPVEISFHCVYG
jgi:hypothetical protein